MKVLEARNVNQIFYRGFTALISAGSYVSPRGQETMEFPTPVASVYQNPCERVLFHPIRDANPYFHFMESLWILAGRKDVEFLSQFNSNIHTFSDNGKYFHGAYGDRLRKGTYWEPFDQLNMVVRLLKNEPDTRQAVLQIWSSARDLGAKSKDIPCNDLIFLKIRDGKLNMRVCCRSNDILWGCYGANVVQFSVLLEYLAARVGVKVGTYTQISDSFHVYTSNPKFKPILEKLWTTFPDPYEHGQVEPYPIVSDPENFDSDLDLFFKQPLKIQQYCNPFFVDVAVPMLLSWRYHKQDKTGATYARDIQAEDWRLACLEWLERRGDTP